ncbi:MAG TPA: STAS domain-containing protein [Solirubrobacteraceae bacterium]|nr:STAS domain-containing protein [Solirubrobacteraceae bacterium]
MKRHLTSSTTSQPSRNQGGTEQGVMITARGADADISVSARAHARPQLTLASTRVWRHTLVLTGRLDYRSAPELEEELECLCEEGVTHLTLDLRQLDAIDSSGALVIAFRSALCRRRGHELTVIPGPRGLHPALARVGATDSHMAGRGESSARRFPALSADSSFPIVVTTMTKDL